MEEISCECVSIYNVEEGYLYTPVIFAGSPISVRTKGVSPYQRRIKG